MEVHNGKYIQSQGIRSPLVYGRDLDPLWHFLPATVERPARAPQRWSEPREQNYDAEIPMVEAVPVGEDHYYGEHAPVVASAVYDPYLRPPARAPAQARRFGPTRTNARKYEIDGTTRYYYDHDDDSFA